MWCLLSSKGRKCKKKKIFKAQEIPIYKLRTDYNRQYEHVKITSQISRTSYVTLQAGLTGFLTKSHYLKDKLSQF